MSRAAGPQCQHVRGMPCSSCLTVGKSVSGALCVAMDQGVWCCWTVWVACLCPFGASSRMVGGVQPSPDRGGLLPLLVSIVVGLVLLRAESGVLVLEGFVRRVYILGSWNCAYYFRGACAEICLEDAARWPWRVEEERGVLGFAWGHDCHVSGGDVHYGDRGSHEAQGVHFPCRPPVDVGVRGHKWPLLIAMVVCQDGVCVVR